MPTHPMGLVYRGLLWFGLYLVLVLGPLAAAGLADPPSPGRGLGVELGVAAGFVAFGLLVVELALVARLRVASEPFGTDALMLLHRWMGIAALGFVLLHPHLDGGAAHERHCAGCHDAGELAARLASAPDPAGTVLAWLELLEDHGTATTGEDVAIVSWLHARR